MTTFPRLKTGAVMQYPASRTECHATATLRFVGGGEQRYRERGRAQRRWFIRLELLDDTELAEVEEFFRQQHGRAGSFSFEDPWEGTVYENCSFEQDELALECRDQGRGGTTLAVRRNEA